MSLYINGTKVIEGKFINGKSTLPSISFITDPDSGFYRIGANNIGLALGGVKLVDWTSTLQTLTRSSLGATTDSVLYLKTLTAAEAGSQQASPAISFRGNGWKTDATAESQPVDFQQFVNPIQGTSAPTGSLIWQARINDGSWSDRMALTSTGVLYVGDDAASGATGTVIAGTLQGGGSTGITVKGTEADDATAIAFRIGNTTDLTNSAAKLVSIFSDNISTERAYIDYRGGYFQSSALALGTTTTSMIALANTTDATDGAQQVSPAIKLKGYGWATGTSASMPVEFRQYILPIQGASAPTGTLYWQTQINTGGWVNRAYLESNGNFVAIGNIASRSGATVIGAYTVGGFIQTNGNYNVVATGATNPLGVGSNISDGASAIAVQIGSINTFSTAGAKLASFVNNAAEKAYVDKDGLGYFNGLKNNAALFIKRTVTGAADYNPSALTTDYLIAVDNTAAARAVIISSEDVASGTTANPRVFEIVDESGACSVNNITISLESGGTINGQASIVLKSDYESGRLIITGTNGVFI